MDVLVRDLDHVGRRGKRLRLAVAVAGPLVEVGVLEARRPQQVGADVETRFACAAGEREQDRGAGGAHRHRPTETPALAPIQSTGVWPNSACGSAKTAGGPGTSSACSVANGAKRDLPKRAPTAARAPSSIAVRLLDAARSVADSVRIPAARPSSA